MSNPRCGCDAISVQADFQTTGFTYESPMVQLSNNSLSDFVRQVVTSYRNTCDSKNVSMVLDLEDVSAPYDRKLVHRAVSALVENAIDSMPEGGELEATLINTTHQWELEIADSGGNACASDNDNAPAEAELPRIQGVPSTTQMSVLNHLSVLMNATIQSWNCPLGGTANVLVVPKQTSTTTNSKSA